jgi:uncharacterized protein YjiS (DUF1127 family)
MAITHTTPELPMGAITVHRVVTAISGVAGRVRAWNDARRTVKALRALSPKQLDDIGLTPADIEDFASRRF